MVKGAAVWGAWGCLALGLASQAGVLPAAAVERVELQLPFAKEQFSINVSELSDPQALLRGSSDLADLDRATNGAIGQQLLQVFHTPLPISAGAFSQDSPLMDQVVMVLASFGELEGLGAAALTDQELAVVIDKAAAGGQVTLLSLLQALPGKTARVDLPRVVKLLNRNQRQRQRSLELVAQLPPAAADPQFSQPGSASVSRLEQSLPVAHRPAPLRLVVLQPAAGGNGRLVVISHGLWDGPASFEGWARHLASHGYTVVLPVHPGSDKAQQRAMFQGQTPPPTPEELRLRPMDVKAVIDAVQANAVPGLSPAATDSVVVVGHSWGAITALQLAGGQASPAPLKRRCPNLDDPERTFSWMLQCSFKSAIADAALRDSRVKAVVAVSPPIGLLYTPQTAADIQARTLLVGGTRDWVVPPDPELLVPYTSTPPAGHRLVLAQGGDHFNLRAPAQKASAPLSGLILAWVQGAFAAGSQVAPGPAAPSLLPPGGWGSTEMVLVDVPPQQAASAR